MTQYYLTFTDSMGKTFTADGSPLYEIPDFDLSTEQTLNIGSQSSGAGAGTIAFNPFTFTLGANQLSQQLDQWLASGAVLDQINLIGYDDVNGKPVQVVHDTFDDVGVKSDQIDPADGDHNFSVQYGALVESATPLSAAGVQGKPVTAGWSLLTNAPDADPTSGVTLPPLNPTTAVAPASATPEPMYARFLDGKGNVIGGGWIEVTGASVAFQQTLNIGSPSGMVAGKVTFDPLQLTFAPGALEPLLLKMEAAGTPIQQLDVAVYSGATGALAQDYRFGLTAIKSSDKTADAGSDSYVFEYGQEQIADYPNSSATPVIEGWDRIANAADSTFAAVAPTTQAAVLTQLADIATGEDASTKYYLSFTDSFGVTFTSDGSPLYAISGFDFSTLQSLNIGSQSGGAGAGRISFNPFSFNLVGDLLTQKLDQWLASGTPLAEINLIGYDTIDGQPVQVVHDAFKDVGLKTDDIDPTSGVHSLAMQYGALVESATPISDAGVQGTPAINGWNVVKNVADASLTAGVGGLPPVTLPTLNPKTAVAAPAPAQELIYARFVDYNNNVVGGGWIELSDASFGLEQTLNLGSETGGVGAGKVSFDPLHLAFAPGTLEPQLLELEASGTPIKQLDVAVYTGADAASATLTYDYRFALAAISNSDKTADDAGTVDYTFQYGAEQIANSTQSSSTPVVSGWSRITNTADTDFTDIGSGAQPDSAALLASVVSSAPTGLPTPIASTATGEGSRTQYYLTFTDSAGVTFTGDGSPLYAISNFGLSTLQTLNIGTASGAGAGAIALNPFTFDLAAGLLTQKLDQWLASGTPLAEINLIGYDPAGAGVSTPVIDDALKFVAVKSDAIDASDGAHSFTVEYAGLVESATPQSDTGAQAAPSADGWNTVTNQEDKSLTSGINGLPTTTLPPRDPATAVAAPTAAPEAMYARILDYNNNVVGSGWIALTGATFGLTQTLDLGSPSGGAGAGKVVFDPLTLSFAAGALEPTLLKDEAAGIAIQQLDVAIYSATGALTQDYRFGRAAIATSDKSPPDAGTVDYTFEYGQEQIATYPSGSATPVVQGWNSVNGVAVTTFATGDTPKTQAAVLSQLANLSTGEAADTPPCFTAGVRLRTERGETAVEALQVGDRLLTLSGEFQPIVWIGRRRYVCGGHPEPEQVWPVVIAAGAIGEGSPVRDLVVSPGHALYLDGRLVQAIRLVNGATIRQAPVAEVDYWHVELPAHDIVFAEGMATESYLDSGNRNNFEGADMTAHPDFGPKTWDETCVPYLSDQALPALRAKLLTRAADFGFTFDGEPELHALADGRSIPPVRLSEHRYAFVFPEGVKQALLVSRTWRPREATPDNQDPRTLGVCIGRLDIDGSTLDLSDERLSEGWSYNEPEVYQRWTTGRASLPPGLRIALLDVCGVGRYLRRPRPFALEA